MKGVLSLTTFAIGEPAAHLAAASICKSFCAAASSARGDLRTPILPLMEAIVVRASDRHHQLLSYLHSPTILSRLLTRLYGTEREVSIRARISRCNIREKWRAPTRFERVTFAFGGQRSSSRDMGLALGPMIGH
jgi:hypothetical protein